MCHKNSDTRIIFCNHPKIRKKWLYHGVMRPKDTDRMASSIVDPDQTSSRSSLIWVYTVCSDLSLRKLVWRSFGSLDTHRVPRKDLIWLQGCAGWSESSLGTQYIWAVTWKKCAPSEDSDQPGHPPSLIRVFAVCMKKAWVLSYPLSAQRRLWLPRLIWVLAGCTVHFVCFVMLWFILFFSFWFQLNAEWEHSQWVAITLTTHVETVPPTSTRTSLDRRRVSSVVLRSTPLSARLGLQLAWPVLTQVCWQFWCLIQVM